jgi:hypothetical protein
VGGDAVRDDDAGTSGGEGGEEAVAGIFEDDRGGGIDAESRGGGEEEVGGGLRGGDVVKATRQGETVEQADPGEVALDPAPRGTRGDGAGDSQIRGGVEELEHAGKRGELFHAFEGVAFAPEVAIGPVDRGSDEGFEVRLWIEAVEIAADAGGVDLKRQVVSVGEIVVAPGFVDGAFGVENETVEVENQGALGLGGGGGGGGR